MEPSRGAQSASRRLAVRFVAVVAGLFMLLVLAFGRARDAVIVMVNLPLALIGGAGVFLAGGVLSVASMIGFITLFGIATRNGIMVVSHIQHLMVPLGWRRVLSERDVPVASSIGATLRHEGLSANAWCRVYGVVLVFRRWSKTFRSHVVG